MLKNHTHITLLTSQKNSNAESIVIEVLTERDIKTAFLDAPALAIAKKNKAKK